MRRKSTSLKQFQGTARPDRTPKRTALDRLAVPPPPPSHLSQRAQIEWVPLATATVELGVLTSADMRALELLAEVLATESELREVLKKEGLTIVGSEGGSKAHPGCKLLESTRNQAARLLCEFGLTPKGRQGVDIHAPASNVFAGNGKRHTTALGNPIRLDKYADLAKPWRDFD
jgi:P27 family predicted phage terminase small subunit